MDFTINVKFDASPALVGLLSNFLGGSIQPVKTVIAPPIKEVKTDVGGTTETLTQTKTETAANETSGPGETTHVCSMEEVRALASAKAKINKEKTFEALHAFGVSRLSDLPEDKFSDYMDALNNIQA